MGLPRCQLRPFALRWFSPQPALCWRGNTGAGAPRVDTAGVANVPGRKRSGLPRNPLRTRCARQAVSVMILKPGLLAVLGVLGCCPAYALHIQLSERRVKPMSKKPLQMPRFKSESEEADWWASPAGRAYVKHKSAEAQSKGAQAGGSSLVAKLNKKSNIRINRRSSTR